MAHERERLLAHGLSDNVIQTIQGARAGSTRTQYAYKWRVFGRWCQGHQVDPVTCGVRHVLEFLQGLMDAGQKPPSLKVYVAAISACHANINGAPVNNSLLVSRYMKGARKLRPPVRNIFPKWDLTTVLDGLAKPPFEPTNAVDLKHLSLKTALLLA